MTRSYKIEVDCANCANLMEQEVNKIEGVANAKINFMLGKITIEFSEGYEEKQVMKSVLKSCKKIEDDCEIYL